MRRRALLLGLAVVGIAAVAHADIEEQRRRLPPPPPEDSCADTVEGEWQSLFWTQGWWLARTLRVRRASPGSTDVVGTERVETWDGRRDAPARPAACDPRAPVTWYTGESLLTGTFDGTVLDVRADALTLLEQRCGAFGGYFPDHFRGPIADDELHTTNDDAHNPETVVVFRRVACTRAAAPPPVVVVAPPAAPHARTGGCGCAVPGT